MYYHGESFAFRMCEFVRAMQRKTNSRRSPGELFVFLEGYCLNSCFVVWSTVGAALHAAAGVDRLIILEAPPAKRRWGPTGCACQLVSLFLLSSPWLAARPLYKTALLRDVDFVFYRQQCSTWGVNLLPRIFITVC